MTEIQHGNGTTPERARRGKVEVIETAHAGVFAQRDVWPDIVAWMLDCEMLGAEHGYAWDGYCKLKHGTGGTGHSDESWGHQEWLIFQKKIGHKHLIVLGELSDYPVPRDNGMENRIAWGLKRCLPRIVDALNAADKAAQDARDEIRKLNPVLR